MCGIIIIVEPIVCTPLSNLHIFFWSNQQNRPKLCTIFTIGITANQRKKKKKCHVGNRNWRTRWNSHKPFYAIYNGCGYGFGIPLTENRKGKYSNNSPRSVSIGPSSLTLRMSITICRVHDTYPRPMIILSAWQIHRVAVCPFALWWWQNTLMCLLISCQGYREYLLTCSIYAYMVNQGHERCCWCYKHVR